MSDAPQRYTVLGAGERYVTKSPKSKGGKPKPPEGRSLDEVRTRLTAPLASVVSQIETMPRQQRLSEVVVELCLDERFLAKSYNPSALLEAAGLTPRGVGSWEQHAPQRGKSKPTTGGMKVYNSRSLFVSGPIRSIKALQRTILQGGSNEVDSDVIKLEGIRLPKPGGDSGNLPKEHQAVEAVLFAWDGPLHDDALERVRALFEEYEVPPTRIRIKEYSNGPTFVAAVIPPEAMRELGEFNFLRSVRPLPRVHLSKQVIRRETPSALPLIPPGMPTSRIAVFDGGYAAGHPILDRYVEAYDCTKRPPHPDLVEHGTRVSCAAIFGPLPEDGSLPTPKCKVLSYRVLPDTRGDDDLEMYGVVDALEAQVPKLPPDVKVVNLSLGPPGPIDRIPSRFTYALDRLARECEVLFFIAAGNEGHIPGRERLQAPADSINNLGIGAFRLNSEDEPEPAPYSNRGPGRSGAANKPDLVAFGGCPQRPFYMMGAHPRMLIGDAGTSYASPCAAALSAGLVAAVAPTATLSPEAQRALLIHSAKKVKRATKRLVGHGRIADSVEEVLACTPTRVSVLYQGQLSPRDSWKLPFLLPPDFDGNGTVNLSWTVAFSPEVDLGSPDEYALGGVVLKFHPHSDIYAFNPPNEPDADSKAERVVFNIHKQPTRVQELKRLGWKQGLLPNAETPNTGKKEQHLREVDGKWETTVHGFKGKAHGNLSEPMLTLTVLGRGSWNSRSLRPTARYAAVLTVEASKYDGDLYKAVRSSYPNLQPLMLPAPRSRGGGLRT